MLNFKSKVLSHSLSPGAALSSVRLWTWMGILTLVCTGEGQKFDKSATKSDWEAQIKARGLYPCNHTCNSPTQTHDTSAQPFPPLPITTPEKFCRAHRQVTCIQDSLHLGQAQVTDGDWAPIPHLCKLGSMYPIPKPHRKSPVPSVPGALCLWILLWLEASSVVSFSPLLWRSRFIKRTHTLFQNALQRLIWNFFFFLKGSVWSRLSLRKSSTSVFSVSRTSKNTGILKMIWKQCGNYVLKSFCKGM